MFKQEDRREARDRRHRRVRRKLCGTAGRPRLSVFRSARHIYAQLILDGEGRTLVGASSLEPELRGKQPEGGKVAVARAVGDLLARRARELGISAVVFDRGGYLYHGRVAALAEGARQGGLEF
ncbi:MAG: 50S ribosomal protein L18 [Thermaerobacter sp.]|jgi:large subunit ribosomal protein L18|nr:50S ribosomal protein L18 [Thermaerobacter sp.]MDA8146059.1 50S ribosomal protein L18 [Thermaerobacter sp.]